jgi:ABC-type multidrug transport system ATPase subunit
METEGVGESTEQILGPSIPDDLFDARPEYYTQYFIDNFRSLRTFQIRLEEGLNVFVGPNGSGKTNFIDFLDFLSSFLNNGAAAATSGLGGLSRSS